MNAHVHVKTKVCQPYKKIHQNAILIRANENEIVPTTYLTRLTGLEALEAFWFVKMSFSSTKNLKWSEMV